MKISYLLLCAATFLIFNGSAQTTKSEISIDTTANTKLVRMSEFDRSNATQLKKIEVSEQKTKTTATPAKNQAIKND